jgi:hypothetical protein
MLLTRLACWSALLSRFRRCLGVIVPKLFPTGDPCRVETLASVTASRVRGSPIWTTFATSSVRRDSLNGYHTVRARHVSASSWTHRCQYSAIGSASLDSFQPLFSTADTGRALNIAPRNSITRYDASRDVVLSKSFGGDTSVRSNPNTRPLAAIAASNSRSW